MKGIRSMTRPRGRPRKAAPVDRTTEEIQEIVKKEIYARLYADADKIYTAALDLATGVWVEKVDENGVRRIYKRAPDQKACADLMSRAFGAPVAKTENVSTTEISAVGTLEELFGQRARSLAAENAVKIIQTKPLAGATTQYVTDIDDYVDKASLILGN